MTDRRRLGVCCVRVVAMGRRFCASGMRHGLPLWGLCLLLFAWGMPAPAGDGVQAKGACFTSTTPVQLAEGGNNRYIQWLRAVRDKLQVHHLIPEALSTKQVTKELCDTGFEVVVDGRKRFVPPIGWDVNDPARSILLSTKEAFVKVVGRVLHRGGHIQYNNAWERVMKDIRNQIREDIASGVSMEDAVSVAIKRLDRASANARRAIRVKKKPLYRRLDPKFAGKGENKPRGFENSWYDEIVEGLFDE